MHRIWRLAVVTVFLSSLISTCACSRSRKGRQKSIAQRTFATPEAAGTALVAAAISVNQKALIAIFGPNSRQILFSGTATTDQSRMDGFVTAYERMHRWMPLRAGGQVLQVGTDNVPFPVPLGKTVKGRWYFDTAAGRDEILARRIGKDELTAMDASKAMANAQQQYRHHSHDGGKQKKYAQKLISDPGQHNGLYWPAAAGQSPSPLGSLGAFTQALSSTTQLDHTPHFAGYYFRILSLDDPSGRFTILAYPVEYRNSGIMSFLIGEDGTLYQKDLGQKTVQIAAAMTGADPRDGWTPAMSGGTAARTQ